MQPAPVPVQIGDLLLGKYVVEKVIGAGGMGVVVAVRHRDLGELYAMKFMLPGALENGQAIDRFVREARAAAKLKSEHVASVHDVGRLESGSPYMVMEHLTGNDLEQVLGASGPLSVATAAAYVMQACDAIAEAHEAGIVHRDLKPANLFLTRRANGSPCVKVLDFGISKTLNPDEQANSMTRTSSILGSPYYMSPEQMRSSKNVDARTDIWALGVILYQLTTARVPFPGETITEVCSGVLAEECPSLVTVLAGVSPEFEQVVQRCLAKRPEQRFQSARELAAALAPIAGASPGTSGLDLPRPARTMAFDSRPPQPGMPQAAPMPTQIGTIPVVPPAVATQAGWGTTQPKLRSGAPVAAIAIATCVVLGGAGGGYFFFAKGAGSSSSTDKGGKAAPATASTSTSAAPSTSTSAAPSTSTNARAASTSAAPSEPVASAPSADPSASAPIAVAPPGPQPKGKPVSRPAAPTPLPPQLPPPPPAAPPKGHGIF